MTAVAPRAEGTGASLTTSKRTEVLEDRPVNLDGFVEEWPEKGLVAMESALRPAAVRARRGRPDRRARRPRPATEFDFIDSSSPTTRSTSTPARPPWRPSRWRSRGCSSTRAYLARRRRRRRPGPDPGEAPRRRQADERRRDHDGHAEDARRGAPRPTRRTRPAPGTTRCRWRPTPPRRRSAGSPSWRPPSASCATPRWWRSACRSAARSGAAACSPSARSRRPPSSTSACAASPPTPRRSRSTAPSRCSSTATTPRGRRRSWPRRTPRAASRCASPRAPGPRCRWATPRAAPCCTWRSAASSWPRAPGCRACRTARSRASACPARCRPASARWRRRTSSPAGWTWSAPRATTSRSRTRRCGAPAGCCRRCCRAPTSCAPGYSAVPNKDNMFAGSNLDTDDYDDWNTIQRDMQVDGGLRHVREDVILAGPQQGRAGLQARVRRARPPADHRRGDRGGDLRQLAATTTPTATCSPTSRAPAASWSGASPASTWCGSSSAPGSATSPRTTCSVLRQRVSGDLLQTAAVLTGDLHPAGGDQRRQRLRRSRHRLPPDRRAVGRAQEAPPRHLRREPRGGGGMTVTSGPAPPSTPSGRSHSTRSGPPSAAPGPRRSSSRCPRPSGPVHEDDRGRAARRGDPPAAGGHRGAGGVARVIKVYTDRGPRGDRAPRRPSCPARGSRWACCRAAPR